MRNFKWTVLAAAILYIGVYLGIRVSSFKVPQLTENGSVSVYLGSSESDVDSFFSMDETELERFPQRNISLRRIFSIMVWLDEKLTGAEFIDLNAAYSGRNGFEPAHLAYGLVGNRGSNIKFLGDNPPKEDQASAPVFCIS